MEAGVVLLLFFAVLGTAAAADFYGDSISFMPPQKKKSGAFKVTFHHRQNGRGDCKDQSSFKCDGNVCTSFDKSSVAITDKDNPDKSRWCQSEGQTTAMVSTDKTTFSLKGTGCCWVSNVNGKKDWTSEAELNLGTRSDSHTINSCPVTTTVSSLRISQNCFQRIRLLTYDPDGDNVKCRFTNNQAPPNFSLNEETCTITSTGTLSIGVHVFEIMLEDFPTKNLDLTYADGTTKRWDASNKASPPLCKVKLQFSLEILAAIPRCDAGHVQPMFLSMTPSHGDVLYATVGQLFTLNAQAQAHHSNIFDFQVSGPGNMAKKFTDEKNGKAKLTLSWTPQQSDLYRFVPVCFTAETTEAQSEMRCVVLMVTQASITEGKASVDCSSNKITVALEKASMPGIDENYLMLGDKSCSLTSNSTHIMGTMSLNTCGTKLEDKGDIIAFRNEILSFELPSEVIVRRKTVKIGFSCQFPKTVSISSYYNLHKSDYVFTESNFGSFGYTFEVYQDKTFKNKVLPNAYPVQVKLLQTLYMGIQAQSELPNVKLFVESCKGTPDDNPDNARFYDLIKNGCVQDETLKVQTSDQTSFNFEVQSFKFSGNFDQVYITCSVILCELNSQFSRCAQGCIKDPSRRRKRDLSKETMRRDIMQGPLQFIGQADPFAVEDDTSDGVVVKNSYTPTQVVTSPVTKSSKVNQESTKDQTTSLTISQESSSSRNKTKESANISKFKENFYKHMRAILERLNSNLSTMVLGSCFLVTLVVLAVVICYFTRKTKAEDRKALLVSGWEN
ncbi:uncharacterized protein V6R79_009628 [Siganus canaliculatus]